MREAGSHALVIDYSPEIVRLLRAVLQAMAGIERIDSTSRGDVAAKMLESDDYDVVILEPVVPYGEERLLQYLARSRPSICSKTILITAVPVAPPLLAEILEARPCAILYKPFDVAALVAAVRRCVGARSRRMEAACCQP